MTITWERPKRKVPEEGYKVIAVPFADASQHPPKVYTFVVMQDLNFIQKC